MDSNELKNRTQQFAISIIKFTDELPKTRSSDVLGKQLLRSACSVGANYRSACRAQSYAHFVSKINIVEEESDESLFWLELLNKAKIVNEEKIQPLINEANELTAIFTATKKTSRINIEKRKNLKSKIANPVSL